MRVSRWVTPFAILLAVAACTSTTTDPTTEPSPTTPEATTTTEAPEDDSDTTATTVEDAAAGPEGQKYGGELRLTGYNPPHFDAHSTTTNIKIVGNVNNRLIHLDTETGTEIAPDLAESWEYSENNTVITFALRSGVTFHDGTALTCTDVKYSFDRQIDPVEGFNAAYGGELRANIGDIACPDDLTVVFNLKHTWPEALFVIGSVYQVIYPEHVARPLDESGEFMNNTLVGTGPFMLEELIPGERIVLERNDDYWNEGLPYLDKVIHFFTDTADVRSWASSFASGQIDVIMAVDSPTIFKELTVTAGDQWKTHSAPGSYLSAFVPDMKAGSIWNDIDVRRAAALALVQDEAIEVLCVTSFICWSGGALQLPDVNPFGLPHEEVLEFSGYGGEADARREEARQILEEKGLVGHEFKMHYWSGFTPSRDTALWACDALNKVGFVCSSQGYETAVYYGMINAKQMPTGDATGMVMGGSWPAVLADTSLSQFWTQDGVRNYGDYKDAHTQELFEAQSTEADPEKRKELIDEFQKYALSQYYHVAIGWRGTGRAWWSFVRGPGHDDSTLTMTTWPSKYEAVWLDK